MPDSSQLPTDQAPPPLPESDVVEATPVARTPVARWRWALHLLIMGSYPLLIALLSSMTPPEEVEAALSANIGILLFNLVITMVSFFVFLGLAWSVSRVSVDQLMLRWKSGLLPWALGFGYSFAMRLVIGIVVYIVVFVVVFGMLASRGEPMSLEAFQETSTELMEENRPQVEHLVDTEAIVSSPMYLLLNITLVSFVMAGFREELWRSSMLAGFRGLFPQSEGRHRWNIAFVLLIAVIFGIGHLPQGMGGVILTGALGVMLGFIMVYHKSIWQATWAHGFFNATSFVGMYFLFKYKDQFESLQKMFGAE